MILYCVTDRRRFGLPAAALVERAGWLARAGVDYLQIRERDLPDRDLFELTVAIVAAAAQTRTAVLVNDRVDVALAAGAAGVHLREDSVAGSRMRALAPRPFVLTRAVHDVAAVRAACADGSLDLLLFGTVFRSPGKPPGHAVAGLDALRDACAASTLPVIAIGGIDEQVAADVHAAGAAGVAVVGALLEATSEADARARVARLRQRFDSGSAVV